MSTISITKRPAMMNDDELAALAGLAEEDLLRLRRGQMASAAALMGFLAVIPGEQEKCARQRGRPLGNGDARESLYRELDEMHARRRAAVPAPERAPADADRSLALQPCRRHRPADR
jgi:hypothetical protein